MEIDQTDTPGIGKQEGLDLSSLLNVDFVSKGWEENKTRQPQQVREPRSSKDQGSKQDRRDRRAPQSGFGDRGQERQSSRERREPRGETRDRDQRRGPHTRGEAPVQKPVEIQFFPEEHAFNALVKALRQSGQTHELFTLTRLFLEKPERLMVAINPLPEAGEDARMYVCKIDGAPFLSEDEVYQHVFKHHLGQYVQVEEVEVEAPKGSFQTVARCRVTKVLLCPPNYHRYPQAILEHKELHFPEQSIEWVRNQLELVRDEDVIQQWLDSMRKKTRYRLLPKKGDAGAKPQIAAEPAQEEPVVAEEGSDPVAAELEQTETAEVETPVSEESAPEAPVAAAASSQDLVFDSLEELKDYFQTHLRHRVLKSMRQYRIEGKQLSLLPESLIRKSIELALEEQRRFPLETANHLRGRFRRLKFDLFKHGERGINYVSPVKRKVKEARVPWSDSVEVLYGRIAQLSKATIHSLAEAVLGNPLDHYQGSMAEKLREDERRAYSTLVADLHWLVMEGYVTRFEDGHLEILKASHIAKDAAEEPLDS
jgi:hypothetical protein